MLKELIMMVLFIYRPNNPLFYREYIITSFELAREPSNGYFFFCWPELLLRIQMGALPPIAIHEDENLKKSKSYPMLNLLQNNFEISLSSSTGIGLRRGKNASTIGV